MISKERAKKMSTAEIAKAVVYNLVKCIFCFYAGFFIVSTLAFGSFSFSSPYKPVSSFDFSTWIDLDKCCTFETQAKSNAASLFGGYAALLLLLLFHVQKAHWLFIITVTIVHIVISCAVKRAFPLSYSFWLCLIVFGCGCLFISDIIIFFVLESKRPESEQVNPDKLKSTESLQSRPTSNKSTRSS